MSCGEEQLRVVKEQTNLEAQQKSQCELQDSDVLPIAAINGGRAGANCSETDLYCSKGRSL